MLELNTMAVMVYIASTIATSIGLYNVMTSRSLIRLFISLELVFNSVILTAAFVGYVVGVDSGFYSLLITTIALTIAEIVIVSALLVLIYRRKYNVNIESLREIKG